MPGSTPRESQALLDAINRACADPLTREELLQQKAMRSKQRRLRERENLVEQRVTYTLEVDGKLFVVENVPARVDQETGEQFFSSETVERLQEIVHGEEQPVRVIQTPVFDYVA